jgi:hypothetical protein
MLAGLISGPFVGWGLAAGFCNLPIVMFRDACAREPVLMLSVAMIGSAALCAVLVFRYIRGEGSGDRKSNDA